MKNLISLALCYRDGKLLVLNQQKLPLSEEWIHCRYPMHMREIIHSLQVRGAPLIGVAAAVALADYAKQNVSTSEIYAAAEILKSARPTAVNLSHCINRQLKAFEKNNDPRSLVKVAEELFEEDKLLCDRIAKFGFEIINENDNILTHCNTGALVTTGIGTALGVIHYAYQHKKNCHVYVDETRPLLQGARLTTWELQRAHIPYTLICDNMAACLMQQGKVDKIIVGADRIAKNGDFANKIGTYSLAVLARYHRIPFYVAAPYTTIDFDTSNGSEIVIEQRAAHEVLNTWATPDSPVFNPAFDVTPAELVTGFILDQGLVTAIPAANPSSIHIEVT